MNVLLAFGLKKTGLALTVAQVGEFYLCFVIDTGATLSLLEDRVAHKLKDLATRSDNKTFVLGINGKMKKSKQTIDLSFQIDNESYTQTFVCESLFNALSKIELDSDIQVHGILGNDFLIKNKWIIDFDKLEVYTK